MFSSAVRRWVFVALPLVWGGCQCTTDLGDGRYACTTNDDCAPDFTCRQGTCQLFDGGTDDAGVVPTDAGLPDAGVTDAGVPDAGLNDAGAPDAGAPDAGPGDAGVDAGPDPCGPLNSVAASGIVPVFCALHRPISVDGDLSDWAGIPFTPLNQHTAALVRGVKPFTSDAGADNPDFSTMFALQWSTDYLYVAVSLKDDIRGVHDGGTGNRWADDSVQLYWDGKHDRTPDYMSDDGEIDVRVDNVGQQYIDNGGTQVESLPPGILSGTHESGVNADWTVELAIPWGLLGGAAPSNGRTIGFDIIVDDDDNPAVVERTHYLLWTEDPANTTCTEPYCDTRALGAGVLTGAPP